MLSAFTKKNKSKSRSNSQSARDQSQSRKPLSILDPSEIRSTTVKFKSDQPTQIWQASPSPSPTASEMAHRCRWNGRVFTGTDSSDDSSISDQDLHQQNNRNSSSSTSTSSLDEGLVAEQERRKVRKRRCHKQKAGIVYCQTDTGKIPVVVDFLPPRPRSLSTSSSSSTESSTEDPNLNWSINSASIQVHSQLSSVQKHHPTINLVNQSPQASIGTPQLVYHPSFGHKVLQAPHVFLNSQVNSPAVSTMRKQSILTQKESLIYSPVISRSMVQQSPMVISRSSEINRFYGKLLQIVSDYLPSKEWQVQYRVLCVRKGDFVSVERQPPKTPKDEASGANSWLMVRKWCPNHHNFTGQTGFVPRHLCRLVTDSNNDKLLSSSYVYNTADQSITMEVGGSQHNYSTASVITKSTQPSTGPPSTNSQETNQVCVFGSGVSLTYGSEHEDRDSGRGPSSGSEWSSAGCKTSRDSASGLDTAFDDLEQLHSRLSTWNDPDSQAWLAESQSVTDSPPLLPPPMEPLKDPLGDRFAAASNSEVLPSPPQWVDQRWVANRDNTNDKSDPKYEPYKTMIQLSENALEKLTLV